MVYSFLKKRVGRWSSRIPVGPIVLSIIDLGDNCRKYVIAGRERGREREQCVQ